MVLGFNLLVILWGALVRASKSGEGCGDHWPLCNGTVIPHAAQIATVIEFTHRASIPVESILVVVMAAWAYFAYRRELVWKAAAASLVLLVIEALLGAGLVLFKYTGTDVSVGRMVYLSAHLVNTLLLVAAMALTAWWASGNRAIEWSGINARLLGGAIAGALLISITGAITALSDTLFPVNSLGEGLALDFSAAAPALVKLRIWHPVIGALSGAYIATVAVKIGRASRLATTVIVLVVLQTGAGMLNLLLLTPIWMQLVHLLLADFLWIALVLFTASVLEKSPTRQHTAELVHP